MKMLIADDDKVIAHVLERLLQSWGHEPTVVNDGLKAWEQLQGADPPSVILIDWRMPDLDGLELCRRIRTDPRLAAVYIIMLTSLRGTENIVEALSAGANDFVQKPFQPDELRARIGVGVRVVQLYADLQRNVHELETALAEIKQLRGILPICSYCKKIRDDQNYWQQVESYLATYANARFSHGICPECFDKEVKPQFARLQALKKNEEA